MSIIDVLTIAGLGSNESAVMAFLVSRGVAQGTRDIEIMCVLRQPEVSLALKKLQATGWVRESGRAATGYGRTGKTYEMAMPLKSIIDELMNIEEKRHSDAMERIHGLRT